MQKKAFISCGTVVLFVLWGPLLLTVKAQQTKTVAWQCGQGHPFETFYSEAAFNQHNCNVHGVGCPTSNSNMLNRNGEKMESIWTTMKKNKERKKAEANHKKFEDAYNLNHQGIEYQNIGDWVNAVRLYEEAARLSPDDENIRSNLKNAKEALQIIQEAELQKQQQVQREQRDKDAVLRMQQSIQGFTQKKDSAISTGGLDFMTTSSNTAQITNLGFKNLPPPDTKYNNLPPKYRSYMTEVDNIVVPPLTWEQEINMETEQLRIGQATDKNKDFMLLANAVIAVFDLSVSSPTTATGAAILGGFKVLLIGFKSTIAAQDQAEVVVFSNNAMYEKMLLYLKDKNQGPQFLAAIKSIRENKPMPPGINPDMVRLATATQLPASGASSVHLFMNAMLSKEAKAAFFETAKVEGMELLNTGIRGLLGTSVQNRSSALRDANEKINMGQEFLKTEKEPLIRSVVMNKLEEIEKKMLPFEQIPEGILSFIDTHEKYEKLKKNE